MSLLDRLRRNKGRMAIQLVIRGRIGEGWYDIDRTLKLPAGTSLRGLIDAAESKGIPIRVALERSPHLPHTLMLNGERCPVHENEEQVLCDGDQVYLLAPLAGG